ncbi:response regulator [Ureibacillus aquaedulcis]|uniref:Response regulator n=1 Tax=Ureibacillus aquaedulcis TaxID=3058421 RepID=A0ABT8GMQ1_9BACL|nr:response regulator [Ureibacillus sp. BA0131]MDN4492693.1 response regulator [Ureibacillus sp. BA0131]
MVKTASLFNVEEIRPFFELSKASIRRSRQPFTILILKLHVEIDASSRTALVQFLAKQIRLTDILFHIDEQNALGLLLTESGASEASALLNRLEERKPIPDTPVTSCIIEIRNESVELHQVLKLGIGAIQEEGLHRIHDFEEQKTEEIKVSIVEENSMFRRVLATTIESIHVKGIELKVQLFEDGQAFLESDWLKSAHTHIVIMNDVLPRRNGIDILNTIRQMPNQQKFFVFMMTNNKSEEEMILSFDRGADGIFIKPFNIRLFEAQIKRTCKRLWR